MNIYDQNIADKLGISSEIQSLIEAEEVHNQLIKYRTRLMLEEGIGDFIPHYRTEQFYGWNIISGLYRGKGSDFSPAEGKALEEKAIIEFERVVKEKIGDTAFRDLFNKKENGKSWDLLMQAQHGGIRTSLIDWTMYIQRSLFFGVEESGNPDIENADAQLWAYMVETSQLLNDNGTGRKDSFHDYNPFTVSRGFMVNTPVYIDDLEQRIYEQRIARQGGRFYISPADKSNIPMNEQPEIAEHLFRFKIPAQCKSVIREELNARGVNRSSIYVEENPAHKVWTAKINLDIYGF